jgi:hypothetical protein
MDPEPQGTDEELVREALKRHGRLALTRRYGGLGYEYKLSRAALQAFERMTKPKQLRMEER